LTRRVLVLFATAACVLASACGGNDDDSRDGDGAQVRLSIEAHDGPGTVKRAQLVCKAGDVSARGLPANDRELCTTARDLALFLSEQPPADRVCTQIYGGPETARIVGQIEGRRIDRRFSRSDGCRVADWDRAQPLIPLQPQRRSGPR
jgi:hypothetical protein